MQENKQLSVIIVTYNDAHQIINCAASICQKFGNQLSWEIIIVNNDEKQDLRSLPIDFSNIKIVNHGKNVGFGSGINMGVKEASGKFLLILNPDTEIITDNVNETLAELSKDEVGVIGAGIINRKNETQEWSAGREVSLFELVRNNLGMVKSAAIWNSPKKIECDWVAGTALFIKKDFFEKLGGFDENFFMYFEDMDLCRRARKLGKKVIFCPEFKIFHGNGKSYTNKEPHLQKKHYYNSLELYFRKNYGLISWIVIKLARKMLELKRNKFKSF